MTSSLTIRRIEGTLSVSISEFADELGLREGDQVLVHRTPNGIELMPSKADSSLALELARSFMDRYPSAMKKLAE